MKLSRPNERFVYRVMVLAALAVVMGIGVVVVKESREMQKLIEPSFARDLLLLMAPLAGLAMIGYSLTSKMFSSGGLLGEFIALLGSYSLFLAVALPSFFKRELKPDEACEFWQFFCDDQLLVRDNRIVFLFVGLAAVFFVLSLTRARLLPKSGLDR